jgi:hypothetical protein
MCRLCLRLMGVPSVSEPSGKLLDVLDALRLAACSAWSSTAASSSSSSSSNSSSNGGGGGNDEPWRSRGSGSSRRRRRSRCRAVLAVLAAARDGWRGARAEAACGVADFVVCRRMLADVCICAFDVVVTSVHMSLRKK